MSAQARQNSGKGILAYGQRETDCLRRPFFTTLSAPAARPATAAAASVASSSRLVIASINGHQSIRNPQSAIRNPQFQYLTPNLSSWAGGHPSHSLTNVFP